MGVRIVTDSSAVMPQAWLDRYPLHIVPVQLAWRNGETSGGDGPYEDLAARRQRGEPPPTTAAPSPGAYAELYERLLSSNDGLLVVCPSADLSTTYNSALLAARNTGGERVRVFDARTAAAGQGIVAAMAARAAADGADLDATSDTASTVAGDVAIWATLSQLGDLRRSGRVPAVAAVGVATLRIHPIIRYTKGSPTPVAVARSAERARERLWRAWKKSVTPSALCHLVAFHAERSQDAEELCRRVRDSDVDTDPHVVQVTAGLAAHTGPGLLGLAWWWEPLH